MKKLLLTTTAGLGIVLLAAAPAKAFVPIVLAAIIGGSILTGALFGSVISNQQTNSQAQYAAPAAAAPACYLKHHNGHLVQVCR